MVHCVQCDRAVYANNVWEFVETQSDEINRNSSPTWNL